MTIEAKNHEYLDDQYKVNYRYKNTTTQDFCEELKEILVSRMEENPNTIEIYNEIDEYCDVLFVRSNELATFNDFARAYLEAWDFDFINESTDFSNFYNIEEKTVYTTFYSQLVENKEKISVNALVEYCNRNDIELNDEMVDDFLFDLENEYIIDVDSILEKNKLDESDSLTL